MSIDFTNNLKSVLNHQYFDNELRQRLNEWQEEPFRQFLLENDAKVVAKLDALVDPEDQRDIGLELFVARMFSIAGGRTVYEPKKEGPDFKIQYENTSFYCEVRRIREYLDPPTRDLEFVDFPPNLFRKIGDILCEKFLQLENGAPNIIYIRSNGFTFQKVDFDAAVKSLASLVEDRQTSFFVRKGYRDENHFLELSRLCSAIVFHHFWVDAEHQKPFFVSLNPNAEYPLSEKIIKLLHVAADIQFKIKSF